LSIRRALEKSKKTKLKTDLDSKMALLEAAKAVFAEQGFEGATVKDLADAAGVNVSLVSYYFDGKENLYRECLATFGRHHVESAQRVLKTPRTAEEFRLRLHMFAEEFVALHKRNPEVCKIIRRDFESFNPIAMDVFKETFLPMYETLVGFVAAARSAGLLRKNIDPDTATAIMFGGLVHLIRTEAMQMAVQKYSLLDDEHLEKTLQHYVLQSTQGLISEKHL
jgi:AcrR family transcriptional regulator